MPAVNVGAHHRRPEISLAAGRKAILLVAAGLLATVGLSCVPQSQECADFVTCQQAYDSTVDTAPFEPGGSCWASPQQAAACDDQCEEALASLRQLPDPPPECAAAQ